MIRSAAGTRSIRTWMGNFGKLDIGGEAIGHPRLRFGNIQLDNGDMLIVTCSPFLYQS